MDRGSHVVRGAEESRSVERSTREIATTPGSRDDSRFSSNPDEPSGRPIKSQGIDSIRGFRYVQPNAVEEICKSKNINELRPFYSGDQVNDRMAAIRDNIVYIRQHWNERQQFFEEMEQFIEDNKREFGGGDEFAARVHKLGQKTWEWGDRHPEVLEQDFDAIRLYTSEDGYKCIFGIINAVFRQDDSAQSGNKIRNAVFIIELLNIDLFNYCLKYPKFSNFEGPVYRGLGLTQQYHEAFKSLLKSPLGGRYISIPLGLWSASSDASIALEIIEKTKQKNSAMIPVVMKIDVIGLKPEYLEYYRRKYPSSVVSTICSVDIHELSDYAREMEVILRGCFCQAMRLYKGQPGPGIECDVLDCVTVNVNRDHISTAFLGEEDAAARELFRHMVTATRSSYAIRYCQEHDLQQDAKEYKVLLDAAEKSLQTLMK